MAIIRLKISQTDSNRQNLKGRMIKEFATTAIRTRATCVADYTKFYLNLDQEKKKFGGATGSRTRVFALRTRCAATTP